ESRSTACGWRAAVAATAAALGRGTGETARRVRYSRAGRSPGSWRESAGPSASAPDLRTHAPNLHQRSAAFLERARAHGPAMGAVSRWSARGGHQPGRHVLSRVAGRSEDP